MRTAHQPVRPTGTAHCSSSGRAKLYVGGFGSQRLFGLVDLEDIERRAWVIVTTADRLEQEVEDHVHDVDRAVPAAGQ
jgi:hypothetical protein